MVVASGFVGFALGFRVEGASGLCRWLRFVLRSRGTSLALCALSTCLLKQHTYRPALQQDLCKRSGKLCSMVDLHPDPGFRVSLVPKP